MNRPTVAFLDLNIRERCATFLMATAMAFFAGVTFLVLTLLLGELGRVMPEAPHSASFAGLLMVIEFFLIGLWACKLTYGQSTAMALGCLMVITGIFMFESGMNVVAALVLTGIGVLILVEPSAAMLLKDRRDREQKKQAAR